MKWFLVALKKYAVFTGRARRKEYWMYVLFYIIFSIAARLIDHLLGLSRNLLDGSVLTGLYGLGMLVPGLAVGVRRMHDIGKSGWVYARFMIAAVVIIIGYMVILVAKLMTSGQLEAIQSGDYDPMELMQVVSTPTLIMLLSLLVLVVWLIVLFARDSQPGENKWGPNPKETSLPQE